MPQPHISVLLPTYNEKDNIVPLIEAIYKQVAPDTCEIIVVDDNSPDGTSQAVQQLLDTQKYPLLRLRTRPTDRGLTKSLREGIQLSLGEIIVWLDCDFSMPPEKIPALLQLVARDGYDIAVGSRFLDSGSSKKNLAGTGESPLAVFLSNILNVLTKLLLFKNFTDYTSGFIAVKKSVLTAIPLRGDYGEYFMDFMVRAILRGYSFKEIPYICVPRRFGESKTGASLPLLIKRGVNYLLFLSRLWWYKVTYKA